MGRVEMSLTEELTESAGDGDLSLSGTFKYAVSDSLKSSISINCGRRTRSTLSQDVFSLA